jgi:adenylosuccinate lyase
MIGRYTSREMQNVWSDENKYATWAAIEVEVMKSQGRSQFGIEVELWRALEMALVPSPDQVARHEERLKHDVMAFLEAWRCNTDNREIHRWLHYGLTSSDVVETGQAVLLSEANWLIANAGYQLLEAFVDHALKYKDTKRLLGAIELQTLPWLLAGGLTALLLPVMMCRSPISQARWATTPTCPAVSSWT